MRRESLIIVCLYLLCGVSGLIAINVSESVREMKLQLAEIQGQIKQINREPETSKTKSLFSTLTGK